MFQFILALTICAIITVMKKYKSIIEEKKHDKIALLAKTKFNSVEVLFSKALIVSNVSLDEFVLVNEVLGSTGTECVSVSAFFKKKVFLQALRTLLLN